MRWTAALSTGIAYRHPITEVLAPIERSGIRLLEVSTAPSHLDLRRLERIEPLRKEMESRGLEVHSLHAPFGPHVDITSADPEMLRRSIDQLGRAADALRMLGGSVFVIHPGPEDHTWTWERESRLARSVEGLKRVWELCRERGLTLAVETALPHLLGGQPADLAWILERIPAEGTGVCLDTSHTSLGGCLFEAIERFGDRLVHLQASDNRGVTDDHLPPGEGILDWPRIVFELGRVRYPGPFLVEATGDGDVEAAVERTVAAMKRTVPSLFLEPARS